MNTLKIIYYNQFAGVCSFNPGNGKKQGITQEDILAVGEKFGIRKSGTILKNINEVVRNFKHYADKYKYPLEKTDILLASLCNKNLTHNLRFRQ